MTEEAKYKEHDAEAVKMEIDTDIATDRVESERLIPGARSSAIHTSLHASSDSYERRDFLSPTVVVLFAFVGIAYYFAGRPTPKSVVDELAGTGLRDIAGPTILISIDGFRHEYLSRKAKDGSNGMLAPNLNKIAKDGVYASKGMQPVVPTITFPNHWTIVTGLYPEYHGIVGNTMYDPVKKEWFHLNRKHPDWWYGVPIWQTLRETPRSAVYENGTKKTLESNYTTACVFWPGSDVPRHAANTFWNYDGKKSYEDRVERAVALLNGTTADLDRKAQFVTLYFEGVDHAGHRHGPNSDEVKTEIKRADDAIGTLLQSLGPSWSEKYNIIIVSDHGMTELSPLRTIDLEPAVKQGTMQDIVTSPLGLFLNVTVSAEDLYKDIQKGLQGHEEHAKVYLKEDLPERWHLRQSRLITRVATMATLGWTVKYPHQHLVPDTDNPLERTSVRWEMDKGSHGYDNTFEDMQAIFIAHGPAFRSAATVPNLRAIDLYEMMCHIFGAQPAPNNGSLEITHSSILKSTTSTL